MTISKTLSIFTIAMFFAMITAAIAHSAETYRIGLQNIYTKDRIYCYNSKHYSADECASYYESKGYTRITNLPYKTAKYDFLTVDTYPTRRWRSNELTPRW